MLREKPVFATSRHLKRYITGKFDPGSVSTLAVELKTTVKSPVDSEEKVKIHIWDTAGQEFYKSIGSSFYRKAHGVILVYDVTRRKTFENIENWLTEVRDKGNDGTSIFLIGNKIDLLKGKEEKREVTKEEAQLYAKNKGLNFREITAKNDNQVNELFSDLIFGKKVKRNIPKEKRIQGSQFSSCA